MLFSSYIFWLFFLMVGLVYWGLGRRGQNIWLLVVSYAFYGAWDYRYLSLIALSTVVDYTIGICLAQTSCKLTRKRLLIASLSINLGILGIFKYFGFFTQQFADLCQRLGFTELADLPTLNILLPVGISFYTFQTMSYSIDVYRRKISAEYNLLDFSLFVCFFPQLVAGPIERFSSLMPQFKNRRSICEKDFSEGLYHILTGLFMKIVIADNMAPLANTVFSSAPSRGIECWLGLIAFAFQIYGDFAGYSSIAQGVAKWLGFDLMYNFRNPYFAISPSDFWQKWHISLSQWLRDYLYIPLGGNKFGELVTYRNLMVTMLLGGLWHGAGWTFIVWGLFHGLLLVAYRPAEPLISRLSSVFVIRTALISIMFLFTLVGWLLFRAESMQQVGSFLRSMTTPFEFTEFSLYMLSIISFYVLPLLTYEAWSQRETNTLWLLNRPLITQCVFYGYIVAMLLFFSPTQSQRFIYFQF